MATLTERVSGLESEACLASLEALGRKHGLNLTGSLSLSPLGKKAGSEAEAAVKAAVELRSSTSASGEQADGTAASAGGGVTAGASAEALQSLQVAVDAAVEEHAVALKLAARKAALRIHASATRKMASHAGGKANKKGKKVKKQGRGLRPAAIAKRALAQALQAGAAQGEAKSPTSGGEKGGGPGHGPSPSARGRVLKPP